MQNEMLVIILWVTCGIATVVAGLLAYRSAVARYVGRGAVGVLFLLGGAVVHLVNLVTGVDYGDFADPSFFVWVTDTWHAVVGPNQVLFIGLLAAFEAVVGVLAMCGGRLTRFAYWAVNRDRGCEGGGVTSSCSGIAQQDLEFTRITAGF